jgi:hypothetical protein
MAWGYMNQGHWKEPMKGSYGVNGWIVDAPAGSEPHSGSASWFWRGPTVSGAAQAPLFLEAQRYNGWALPSDRPPAFNGERWNDDAQMGRYCLDRHDGFAGCLFLDYSARKVGLKELWTLKWHREYNQAGPWTKAGGVQPSDWPEWLQHYKDY